MRRLALRLALPLAALALPACALVQDATGERYSTTLSGGKEVPGPGDRRGSGIADITFYPDRSHACFTLEVSDIAPATAAHIHRGRSGEAGPPVLTLAAPTDGKSSDCMSVPRALVAEIRADPARFYVNVHNEEYPAGAVRGQLERQ